MCPDLLCIPPSLTPGGSHLSPILISRPRRPMHSQGCCVSCTSTTRPARRASRSRTWGPRVAKLTSDLIALCRLGTSAAGLRARCVGILAMWPERSWDRGTLRSTMDGKNKGTLRFTIDGKGSRNTGLGLSDCLLHLTEMRALRGNRWGIRSDLGVRPVRVRQRSSR